MSLPHKKNKSVCLVLGLSVFFLYTCISGETEENNADVEEVITAALIEKLDIAQLNKYERITFFYVRRCQSCIEHYQEEIAVGDSASAFVLQTYEPMRTRVLFQDYLDQPNVFLLDVRQGLPSGLTPDPDHPTQEFVRHQEGYLLRKKD